VTRHDVVVRENRSRESECAASMRPIDPRVASTLMSKRMSKRTSEFLDIVIQS
jgi:hypothetical protein